MVLFIGQTEEFNVIWHSIASLKTAAVQESQGRRENASRRKTMKYQNCQDWWQEK